jgi:bacterioferritin
MASKKLMELLNKGIARQLLVYIQYMWQNVLAKSVESIAVENIFREIAIAEMKHAEAIAEGLAYLDGTPTTKPDPIFVGGSPKRNASNRRESRGGGNSSLQTNH